MNIIENFKQKINFKIALILSKELANMKDLISKLEMKVNSLDTHHADKDFDEIKKLIYCIDDSSNKIKKLFKKII